MPPPLLPYWRRLQASPIGYRLAKGAFWSLAGSLISRSLAMAASVLVARALGAEAYGEFGIIRSTVGMFGTLAGFGLGTTATKYIAELRDADPVRAGRIMSLSRAVALITGGLMAAALALLAPWLAANTLAAPHLAGMIRVSGILLLFSAINGAEAGALAGFEAFRAIALRSLWAGLANFPLMVGGVYLFGLAGAVWALVLSMALNWLLNYLAVRRAAAAVRVPATLHGWRDELPVLWQFSLPAALSSAMVGPVTWVCNAMLVNQPNGYVEMGIFTAAHQFQIMVTFVGGTLSAPLLSLITNEQSSNDSPLARLNILATWAVGVFPTLVLLAFPELAELILGEGYGGQAFRLAVIAIMVTSSVVMYRQGAARVLASRGLMWWGVLDNLLWAALLIGSTCLLVPYGGAGLALSYVCAYGLNTLVFVPFYVSRGLIPRSTMLSRDAAVIWGILVSLALVSLYVPSVAFRGLALLAAFTGAACSFRRMGARKTLHI